MSRPGRASMRNSCILGIDAQVSSLGYLTGRSSKSYKSLRRVCEYIYSVGLHD
jgi:hypothetical protein